MRTLRLNYELLLLCVPAIALYALFNYTPMVGLVLPFKNYKYPLGLFGSKWVGFKNFNFLFKSVDLQRILRNTIGYNLLFMVTGNVTAISCALLLYEIKNRRGALKVYQTIITLPSFMSWVVVGFITYAIFNPSMGILNQLLRLMSRPTVDVYTNPRAWPVILPIVNAWKSLGMSSMIYLAALLGIDEALFEAATIDGASRTQQTWYISLPGLMSLFMIMFIMSMGGMFGGDFGLFYQIPRNVGVIYETTDIIDTYVYRGLQKANWPMSSATGFFQSVMGLVMVVLTNFIVNKISPDNALF